MKQLFGQFDLKTNEYSDSSESVYTYCSGSVSVYVMGRAQTGEKINCGEELIKAFCENSSEFTSCVQGSYIACFYDSAAHELCVFHDRSTSPFVLYYTVTDSAVYIGTSLKTVLINSRIKRELNESVIEDFITNGYLYGDETLVKNVFKLKAFHCLEIENGKCSQVKVDYPVEKLTKSEALEAFKPALDKAVHNCFAGESEINIPLSSGFDSNYIAYIASENETAPINAFSVGGKFGKNELPVVEENVKLYKRMQLKSALTDKDTLQNLPDIVLRLEGSVYEVGLFLQYELAKLVCESGKKYLVCGECADQVMNKYYLQPDRVFPEKPDEKPLYYEFSEYPFIFGNYLILKKNGILANSFGIETRYPYLDEKVVAVSHALRSINGKDKRVHTANCSECLPEEILKNMSKIGGATECHSLFNSKDEIKAFFEKIESSSFYKAHSDIIKRHSFAESQKQTGLALVKTKVRNLIMKLLHTGGKDDYFNEEMKLREYICVAYLLVFEKLFISGELEENAPEFNKGEQNIERRKPAV